MKASWTGLALCGLVIYYGIVHSLSNPAMLLNSHAMILVVGGTIAIAFLTYSRERLTEVMDYVLFGFLVKAKKTDRVVAKDLLSTIDGHYGLTPVFELSKQPHLFLLEAFGFLPRTDLSAKELQETLLSRRNAIKRRYVEDAKILNNIAKYPPHLGLLGAASGMIEMMSKLGAGGADGIGPAMAVALTATLWGVGLNNFVFLPLADNATKAAEDELFLRDLMIECALMVKRGASHDAVVETCLNKLSLGERIKLTQEYREKRPLEAISKPESKIPYAS